MGGVVAALALALLLFAVAMQPPFAAFQAMTMFLSATALLSLVAGYAAYRFGWLERSPRLRWTFVASYLLAGALTFVNVWVTARLMFNSDHDLTLAAILLVFAVGIATALGFFLSASVTDNIQALARAAGAVAQGRFDTRVAVRSRDEVAQLADAFNAMAAQLEQAEQQKREVEVMRRDLIAWIGHDLRTPLAAVQARLEALADGVVDDPATVQRYLSTAQRDLHALSALIDDLFEMAQLDAGGLKLDLQPNSLSDLISDALESFVAGAAAQKVNLSGTVAADVDPVVCDAPDRPRPE
ncbi:MAG: HAMP domain-containing protein [Anaerolineales bacterium]|nr:HAMP domain-containing protein [Anaerolineales bacterium]